MNVGLLAPASPASTAGVFKHVAVFRRTQGEARELKKRGVVLLEEQAACLLPPRCQHRAGTGGKRRRAVAGRPETPATHRDATPRLQRAVKRQSVCPSPPVCTPEAAPSSRGPASGQQLRLRTQACVAWPWAARRTPPAAGGRPSFCPESPLGRRAAVCSS